MGSSFKFDDRTLRINVDRLPEKLNAAVGQLVQTHATRGQGYLKAEAPWTDRTGAARTGLHALAASEGSSHSIVFAHSVNYGIWLEVKYSGRDEIIMPTVRKVGRELMEDMNHLMARL